MYAKIVRAKLPHLASKWAKKMSRANFLDDSSDLTFDQFIEFLKEQNEHSEETADILKNHEAASHKGKSSVKVAATTAEVKPVHKEYTKNHNSSASARTAPKSFSQNTASARNPFSSQNASSSQTGCPVCSEQHLLETCRRFNAMSPSDRSKTVWDSRRCFKCLTPNHFASRCTVAKPCSICKKPHHTLLHGGSLPEAPSSRSAAQTQQS